MSLAPGAAVLYDEPLKLNELRNDLIFYSVPFDKLVAAVCPEAKLRKLVKNMIYVGVVAQLLDLDMAEVEKAIRKQFAKKVKAANLNWPPPRLATITPPPIAHQAATRSPSSAWTRPRARSSSTATPPRRWAACSRASRS